MLLSLARLSRHALQVFPIVPLGLFLLLADRQETLADDRIVFLHNHLPRLLQILTRPIGLDGHVAVRSQPEAGAQLRQNPAQQWRRQQ